MPSRPDLSGLSPEVRTYIELLEADVAALRGHRPHSTRESKPASEAFQPVGELPTSMCVITATAGGIIKRTPRHLYGRQRRGGMGVLDLDAPEEDPPAFLTAADASQSLILITNLGRAFPISVSQLAESPVRGRGESLRRWIPLLTDERLALVAPDMGSGYFTFVTRRGQVRRWRHNIFGRSLQPGTILYDTREGGPPGASCWSAGEGDLFIVSAGGTAIRFAEALIPVRGCLGLRLAPDDAVAGIAGVSHDSGVFMLSQDGSGTVRQMTGFGRNQAPGAGGKQAMKAERLVGATQVDDTHDLFVVSRTGKLIRFPAADVPAKEGVVQGVSCMTLRGDTPVALMSCQV